MITAVLMTEAEQTERALTALIVLLLVVAVLLTLLTLWYWRYTSPKRVVARAQRLGRVPGGGGVVAVGPSVGRRGEVVVGGPNLPVSGGAEGGVIDLSSPPTQVMPVHPERNPSA